MMYKNSFKLVFSNFNLVWKLLLYFLVILLVFGSLTYFTCRSLFDVIGITEVLKEVIEEFNVFITTFDATTFLVEVENAVDIVVSLVITNIGQIWHYFLILGLVFIILPSMFNNFYLLSTCNVLHHYMGSNSSFGFTASLFVNFWKNIRYQLMCLVTILPIKLATYYLVIKSFALLSSPYLFIKVLSPFIITVVR